MPHYPPGCTAPPEPKTKSQSKNAKKRERKRNKKQREQGEETAASHDTGEHENSDPLNKSETVGDSAAHNGHNSDVANEVANLTIGESGGNMTVGEKSLPVVSDSSQPTINAPVNSPLQTIVEVPKLEDKDSDYQANLESTDSYFKGSGGNAVAEDQAKRQKTDSTHHRGSDSHGYDKTYHGSERQQHAPQYPHHYRQQEQQSSRPHNQGGQYHAPQHQQSHSRWGNQEFQGYNYQQSSQQYYGPPQFDEVELSKELVRIVRHGKYKFIKLDDEGYASVDQILNDRKFLEMFPGVTFEMIWDIVENNDKKRFEMKECPKRGFMIKATQGHSVKVRNLALEPITDAERFPEVVHGTYREAWEKIKVQGLKRMTRTHIHFAIGMPGDTEVLSGMRNTSDVVVSLNLKKAIDAGLKFFLSSNKVILTEGDKRGRVHPKFFEKATGYYPRENLKFEVPPDYQDEEEVPKRKDEPHRKKDHQPDRRPYSSQGQRDRGRDPPKGGYQGKVPKHDQGRQKR